MSCLNLNMFERKLKVNRKSSRLLALIVGILSSLSLGSKVRAAIGENEQESESKLDGQTDRTASEAETEYVSFLDSSINSGNKLTAEVAIALQLSLKKIDRATLANGIFILTPEGEIQVIGNKQDLDSMKDHIIRLQLETLSAQSILPTTDV